MTDISQSIVDLTNQNAGAEAYWRLDAVMLFPDDQGRQKQYLNFRRLLEVKRASPELKAYRDFRNMARPGIGGRGPKSTLSSSSKLQPPEKLIKFIDGSGVVNLLADLPPTSFSDEIAKLTTDALISGAMLMYIHTLHTGNFRTASGRIAGGSQNIATYVCWKHNLGRERIRKGRPKQNESRGYPSVDESQAREHWQKYRTVAHLWAAYLHLVGHLGDLSQVQLSDSVDRLKLLQLARQYEHFVTVFFSSKEGHSQRVLFKPFSVQLESLENDDAPEIQISEKPDGVVSTVSKWVREYDTEHKK